MPPLPPRCWPEQVSTRSGWPEVGMRVRVTPGPVVEGTIRVPGDKSIAHRWLILAATARGRSALVDLPGSLDVRSTGFVPRCRLRARVDLHSTRGLRTISPAGRGSRFHVEREGSRIGPQRHLKSRVRAVPASSSPLTTWTVAMPARRCGSSPVSLAAAPFHTVLTGDESLRGSSDGAGRRAAPLHGCGTIETDGRARPDSVSMAAPSTGVIYTLRCRRPR